MDFMKLAAVCALGVEPKRIHALVWHQSGGGPWSFPLPGAPRSPNLFDDAGRVSRSADTGRRGLHDHYRPRRSAYRFILRDGGNLHAAGKHGDGGTADRVFAERCKTLSRYGADLVFCAVAAYRQLVATRRRHVRKRGHRVCWEERRTELRHTERERHCVRSRQIRRAAC
jgi:hypothetical protein